jgi:D-alanyl-D-alanine endopeptidase (penicillin-binding protein 7)
MIKLILAVLMLVSTNIYAQQSTLVYNISTGKVVYEENTTRVRPLASITKLMTAMVVLEYDKDLTRRLNLSKRVGSNLPQQQYTREQLITAMLVRSDNAAAETLADDYPGGRRAFIKAMNALAIRHKAYHTHFDDPTGLSARNISTAVDVASIVEAAASYQLIQQLSTKKQVEISANAKRKPLTVRLQNTNNPILFEFDTVVVSKTGFTSRAGWCLAMAVEKDKQMYAIVILGSQSKDHRTRTAERLIQNHTQGE